jgi:2-hydroxychromene-2-carboxylate isomerase
MLEPTKKDNPNPSVAVDPPKPVRLLMSFVLNRMIDPKRGQKKRDAAEAKRQSSGAAHQVDYFHQLDDPYSHLSAQKLASLAAAYDIEIVPHLINATGGKNQPYPEDLATYARRDAATVAPHYNVSFPGNAGTLPEDADRLLAARILAAANPTDFIDRVSPVSDLLWVGDHAALQALADELGAVSEKEATQRLEQDSAILQKEGHYSGGTFQYAGEWFWGIDRLYHLEARLEERSAKKEGAQPVAPRPAIDPGPVKDTGTITLEVFPSLRSPYTSIIFDKTCELAAQSGVKLIVRPVLPMVMRGVPATPTKGQYIFTDTKREANAMGVGYGPVYDPIGEPVRQVYSLFPWATSQGKGAELLSAFLDAAFRKAIRIDSKKGMKKVVEAAGLSWTDAQPHLGTDDWKAEVEENQRIMSEDMGLWGVPSFRVSSQGGEPDFSTWGQDRLWLVADEIKRRIAETP